MNLKRYKMPTNIGVKNGLFLGIALTIFCLISYLIDPRIMFTGIAYLSFLIIIYFMYRAAKEEGNNRGGILSFKDAVKSTFLTFVIGKLIYTIFFYLMLNHFDPSLNEVLKDVAIEQGEWVTRVLGEEDNIDKISEEVENQNFQLNFSYFFMQYLVSLIFPGFIFALVISALMKKELSTKPILDVNNVKKEELL